MKEMIFKKEESFICPCCQMVLPEYYKNDIKMRLLLNGYIEMDCPICRLSFVAEYEVCIKLSTESGESE